jgi:hypothetical protein
MAGKLSEAGRVEMEVMIMGGQDLPNGTFLVLFSA